MKISAVLKAMRSTKNDELSLTVRDSNGLERELQWSAAAQERLFDCLVTRPHAAPGEQQLGPVIEAQNFRLYEATNGLLVLEVQMGRQRTIHIALPNPLPKRLREKLGEDRSTWRGKPS